MGANARERSDKIGNNRIDAEATAQIHPGRCAGRVSNVRGFSLLQLDFRKATH
jgi:hypothetical protein